MEFVGKRGTGTVLVGGFVGVEGAPGPLHPADLDGEGEVPDLLADLREHCGRKEGGTGTDVAWREHCLTVILLEATAQTAGIKSSSSSDVICLGIHVGSGDRSHPAMLPWCKCLWHRLVYDSVPRHSGSYAGSRTVHLGSAEIKRWGPRIVIFFAYEAFSARN